MDSNQLEPPALTPPAPVTAIVPEEAANRVPLPAEETTRLDGQVGQFIGDLTTLDPHGAEFKTRVDAILALGDGDVRASASVANRMLERPMKAMKNGVYDAASPVSKALGDLRNQVEALDPSKQGDLLSPRKLLGLIPFGSKLTAYFDSYRSAQNHLNAIIESLYRSKDELQRDNARHRARESHDVGAHAEARRLRVPCEKARRRDRFALAVLDTSDPERAKILREDVQFYARQKIQDLLTQMAVNVQGYLALDLIKKNNVELIKGVERATTTTVSALRTAVVVAQALANEKLVLNQIGALNATTGNMIESTSAMLKQQSAGVYEQAASATVDVEKLKAAFKNVYDAMDSVSAYKVAALGSMQQTVTALETEVKTATAYLERAKAG